MRMVMRQSLKSLAWRYFEVGAFGDLQSLSPDGLNLRTTDNPNRGPVTSDLVATTGHKLWQEIAIERCVRPYDYIVGLPEAGGPFAEALARAHRTVGCNVGLLEMVNTASDAWDFRRSNDRPRGTVLVIDDFITDAESTLESIAVLTRHEFTVRDVLTLVDLQQGGAEELAKADLRLHALFALDQLRELCCFEHPVA